MDNYRYQERLKDDVVCLKLLNVEDGSFQGTYTLMGQNEYKTTNVTFDVVVNGTCLFLLHTMLFFRLAVTAFLPCMVHIDVLVEAVLSGRCQCCLILIAT